MMMCIFAHVYASACRIFMSTNVIISVSLSLSLPAGPRFSRGSFQSHFSQHTAASRSTQFCAGTLPGSVQVRREQHAHIFLCWSFLGLSSSRWRQIQQSSFSRSQMKRGDNSWFHLELERLVSSNEDNVQDVQTSARAKRECLHGRQAEATVPLALR